MAVPVGQCARVHVGLSLATCSWDTAHLGPVPASLPEQLPLMDSRRPTQRCPLKWLFNGRAPGPPGCSLGLWASQPAQHLYSLLFHCGGPWQTSSALCNLCRTGLKSAQGLSLPYFLHFYLLIFREGEGREKERERNINQLPPVRHTDWGQTSNLSPCRMTANQLSHTGQGFFNFYF